MANQFENIPAPAANGVGAAVDLSTFGATKTFTCDGEWIAALEPATTIEMTNDPAQVGGWAPIATFQGAGHITLDIACRFVRANVANFRGGQAPSVNVGGDDAGTTFAALPAPAGNGAAADVDVSALPNYKTVWVGGTFRGSVIIEVSEDGGDTYAQAFAFLNNGGQRSLVIEAEFMRVTRNGVPLVSPGLPIINVGACAMGGGGGGDTGDRMVFSYTVDGDEPNLSEIVIPLPTPRDDTDYQVQVQQADCASFLSTAIGMATLQVAQFTLFLSTDASAGDVFWFTVDQKT